MTTKFELILHPVRLQIVTTMAAQQMTAQELSKLLCIPNTTLYRHINALVDGGILEIVEETQKRGTVEKLYAIAAPPSLSAEDMKGMQKRDYEQAFMMYITTLISDMQRYLDSKPDDTAFDILADGVDLSKVRLLLSDDEFKQLNTQIFDLMLAAVENQPDGKRKPRVFSYMFIPGEE